MKLLAVICVITALLVVPVQAQEPTNVTLVQLIANPEKFDAKLIRVIGFLRLEFEGNVLYLHREDYENAILGDGIWVDATPAIMKQKATLNMTTFYSKAFSVRVIEGTWVCGAGPSNKSVALNSGDL